MTPTREPRPRKSPAYIPPKIGDVCFIAKGFNEWSSSTRVTIIELELPNDEARVLHEPTHKEFLVPIDYLVRKRNRHA